MMLNMMLAVLLGSGVASAGDVQDWTPLEAQVQAAWQSYGAVAGEQRAQGHERAARAVPVGITGLEVGAQAGLKEQTQLQVGLAIPLSLGLAERGRWRDQATLLQAESRQQREVFAATLVADFQEWWTSTILAAHVEEQVRLADAEVQRLTTAAEEGSVAWLAVDVMRADAARLRVERQALQGHADARAASLQPWLSMSDLRRLAEPSVDWEPSANPWEQADVESRPAVQTAEARATVAEAELRALRGSRRPTVVAGPMWAPDNAGHTQLFAAGGLSWDFWGAEAPAVRAQRGEVAARLSEADQVRLSNDAALAARALQWDSVVEQHRLLQEAVDGPLTDRKQRVQQAFDAQLVPAEALVQALHAHHEAEHDLIRLEAWLRAEAVLAHLFLSTSTESSP